MNIPILLLGAALIFWGWQTELWILAVPMAILLEASHWIQWRWDISTADFRKVANLSLVILSILIVYFLVINPSITFVYTLLQLLPCVFFPILLAQIYSVSDRIDIRTLFLAFNSTSNQHPQKPIESNLKLSYFTLCILAASAANSHPFSFYGGMVILSAFILGTRRSQRFSIGVWIGLFLMASSLGWVSSIGLHNLHLTLEQKAIDWFTTILQQNADPLQRQTAIGEIGKLKLSNGIFFRVKAEPQQITPFLLRESTYNKYNASMWFAVQPEFSAVDIQANNTIWQLTASPQGYSQMTITEKINNGQGVLKLPDGTFQINQFPFTKVEKNQYGLVRVESNSNAIAYHVQFNPQVELDSPPTEDDLQIPKNEAAVLNQIVKELELSGKPPKEIIQRLQTFFENNFTYSLDLIKTEDNITPLSAFLLKNRAGHCEYFATATTLLLRAAGIPARYAIGFSVNEFSTLENQFIVRGRDGHAWTMVYLNGIWQELDTTPAGWSAFEDAIAPKWGIISDLASWLGFQLSLQLKALQEGKLLKSPLGWIIPLILIAIWKFKPQKGIRRLKLSKNISKFNPESKQEGENSEFYKIEKTLNQLGSYRLPSESLKQWIQRLREELPSSDFTKDLDVIVELHYRYRFDPLGIDSDERSKLKQMIQAWLQRFNS